MSVVYKCKMCGGNISRMPNATTGVCESCLTKQTLPKTTDDNIANLFNRANNLRLKYEFDRAEKLYETIIKSDDSEAEAHWGRGGNFKAHAGNCRSAARCYSNPNFPFETAFNGSCGFRIVLVSVK